MIQIVKQRDYIQNFCDFVGSFAITERVSVQEMELVYSNLEILRDRIQMLKEKTIIEPMLLKDESLTNHSQS